MSKLLTIKILYKKNNILIYLNLIKKGKINQLLRELENKKKQKKKRKRMKKKEESNFYLIFYNLNII